MSDMFVDLTGTTAWEPHASTCTETSLASCAVVQQFDRRAERLRGVREVRDRAESDFATYADTIDPTFHGTANVYRQLPLDHIKIHVFLRRVGATGHRIQQGTTALEVGIFLACVG